MPRIPQLALGPGCALIFGFVMWQFMITTTGTIENFRYFRSADEPCSGHNATLWQKAPYWLNWGLLQR